jgi:hypothetical protein
MADSTLKCNFCKEVYRQAAVVSELLKRPSKRSTDEQCADALEASRCPKDSAAHAAATQIITVDLLFAQFRFAKYYYHAKEGKSLETSSLFFSEKNEQLGLQKLYFTVRRSQNEIILSNIALITIRHCSQRNRD